MSCLEAQELYRLATLRVVEVLESTAAIWEGGGAGGGGVTLDKLPDPHGVKKTFTLTLDSSFLNIYNI